jgi:hypothetical protein
LGEEADAGWAFDMDTESFAAPELDSGLMGIVGGAIAGVAGAVAWAFKFREERQQHRNERLHHLEILLRESQKTFLDRQLQIYFEAVKAVAQLGTLVNGPTFGELKERFWELYWGALSVVESQDVENKMVTIGKILKAVDFIRAQDKSAGVAGNDREQLKEMLNNANATSMTRACLSKMLRNSYLTICNGRRSSWPIRCGIPSKKVGLGICPK